MRIQSYGWCEQSFAYSAVRMPYPKPRPRPDRHRPIKPLQEHTRPVLPQNLRHKLQVANDAEVLRELMLEPLLAGGEEEVAAPAWVG